MMNTEPIAVDAVHYEPERRDTYFQARRATNALCDSLAPEDCVVQSMPDVSPTKWHLAHTTWFFENFILIPRLKGYEPFNAHYGYLFNSYYYTVGEMYPRPQRGLISRPTMAEVMDYRAYVDEHMNALMQANPDDRQLEFLVILGVNHEQQHQELLLTDIKHVFSVNPLLPAWRRLPAVAAATLPKLEYIVRSAGVVEIGHKGKRFCFDNEMPRHRELVHPHALASRPVTNGEFLTFIRDGGYNKPELWLADGWATIQRNHWNRPLYWSEDLSAEFTLGGMRTLERDAPVCHVSYFEADAYARWANARLPSEAEWEAMAANRPVTGNLADSGRFHPCATDEKRQFQQAFGDVWEWTASPYTAYPGFRPAPGSLGEYNGKFMCNQFVLRGGSCATPAAHIRATYRNFFPPEARWQFSGIRLARDI
jgi:ergothioneine biosynthesis protein EgtB